MDTSPFERGRERTDPTLREVCGNVHFCFARSTTLLELCQAPRYYVQSAEGISHQCVSLIRLR